MKYIYHNYILINLESISIKIVGNYFFFAIVYYDKPYKAWLVAADNHPARPDPVSLRHAFITEKGTLAREIILDNLRKEILVLIPPTTLSSSLSENIIQLFRINF